LGGSRVSKTLVVRNTFIIFLVSGFWHGANWTFIAWGAFHAVLFLPLILLNKNRKYTDSVAEDRILPDIKELFQMGFTFGLVLVGWVFFRAESIEQAFEYLVGMVQLGTLRASYQIFNHQVIWFILFMLVVEWIGRRNQHGLETLGLNWNKWLRYIFYIVLALMVVVHGLGGEPTRFIYFQF